MFKSALVVAVLSSLSISGFANGAKADLSVGMNSSGSVVFQSHKSPNAVCPVPSVTIQQDVLTPTVSPINSVSFDLPLTPDESDSTVCQATLRKTGGFGLVQIRPNVNYTLTARLDAADVEVKAGLLKTCASQLGCEYSMSFDDFVRRN